MIYRYNLDVTFKLTSDLATAKANGSVDKSVDDVIAGIVLCNLVIRADLTCITVNVGKLCDAAII